MHKTKTVTLAHPIELTEFEPVKLITEVTIKEPTGDQFQAVGQPRIWVNTQAGGYTIDSNDAIKKYTELCVSGGDVFGTQLVRRMTLGDAMMVREELLGFFDDAVTANWERRSGSLSSPSNA